MSRPRKKSTTRRSIHPTSIYINIPLDMVLMTHYTAPMINLKAAINTALSSTTLMLSSACWMFLSLARDVCLRENVWFWRSGAMMAVIGAILGARAIVREGASIDQRSVARKIDGAIYFVGNLSMGLPPEIRARFADLAKEERQDVHDRFIGLWMLVIGSIIGAYGELAILFFQK